MKKVDRVARNFIQRRGLSEFRLLITMLERNTSGQKIADHFKVSRERVRQWKDVLGTTITLYRVHPAVERIMEAETTN